MVGFFPYRRPEPDERLIRVASPVSSVTWTQLAGLSNWVRGKGAQLVPWTLPDVSISAAATEVFRFRVKPRNTAVERIWQFLLVTTTNGVTADLKAPTTGSATVVSVVPGADAIVPVTIIETLSAKSSTEAEINCSIKANGGSVRVIGIACYEQDRPILNEDSTDLGVDIATCGAQQPILDQTYQSLAGVHDVVQSGTQLDGRRVGLLHLTWGDTGTSRTTASYQDLMTLPAPVLAAKRYRTDVTADVKCSVYARVAAGAGGQVRFTATSGDTLTLSVTSTSFAWVTAGVLTVDCEDMGSADGRQTAATPAWDEIQVAFQGDGTNALTLAHASVWEDWS